MLGCIFVLLVAVAVLRCPPTWHRRRRAAKWLRAHGLAPFGFVQEDCRHHHQLLRVWGPLCPPHWEVRRWPAGADIYEELRPLPYGSSERYHRIELSSDPVYIGTDWQAAKSAMCGLL